MDQWNILWEETYYGTWDAKTNIVEMHHGTSDPIIRGSQPSHGPCGCEDKYKNREERSSGAENIYKQKHS